MVWQKPRVEDAEHTVIELADEVEIDQLVLVPSHGNDPLGL
jgi:hypothetical protein